VKSEKSNIDKKHGGFMREKLLSLPLSELREIARSQGIKNIAATRKSALVDKLVELSDAQEARGRENQENQALASDTKDEKETVQQSLASREIPVKEALAKERQGRSQRRSPEGKSPRVSRSAERSRNMEGYDSRGGEGRDYNNRNGNGAESTREDRDTAREVTETAREGREALREGRETAKEVLTRPESMRTEEMAALDSGVPAYGILEVMPEGFGFIRCENYLPGENDVYVSPSQIRRFNMKTGDIVYGGKRIKTGQEKFAALLYVSQVNGINADDAAKRPNFEDLTPIFPNSRLHLEMPGAGISMRIVDLLSPIGKGQRGMIVSPPKAGKTTLLKQIARSLIHNHQDMHVLILLIDERPEEVTDIKESIEGPNAKVIYSTFDELPEHHKRVSEMVLERAKRLVEHGKDVTILLDSITRLARAYNLTVIPSGRTLSGGLDPAALYMPKRFFGAARNMREGGSLTILATALVDNGSRLDDMVYEEFKGTGNMELVLNRKLSERRIFPAVDIFKSGTRRDDLLLSKEEQEAVNTVHRATNSAKADDAAENVLDLFTRTKNNREFIEMSKKIRF